MIIICLDDKALSICSVKMDKLMIFFFIMLRIKKNEEYAAEVNKTVWAYNSIFSVLKMPRDINDKK